MDYKIIWFIFGMGAILSLLSVISQLRNDVARINITLDKIAKQVGVTDTAIQNIDGELKDLISQGKKVKAIKKYRMVTGIGLKEAKEYIDLLSEGELK